MSNLEDDLLQELLVTFRSEAVEHLQTINQSLLKLERAPDEVLRAKTLQDAFRAAHSLKGAARAVSLGEIETLAHAMESVFQKARDAGLELGADICDVLYDGLDMIEHVLAGQIVDVESLKIRLLSLSEGDAHPISRSNGGKSSEENVSVPAGQVAGETIRVAVNKLDDLMAQVGELLISKISADQRLVDSRAISQQMDHWLKSWRELKAIAPRVEGEVGRQINTIMVRHAEQTDALIEAFRALDQGINRDTVRLGIVANGLQDKVRDVRMVPFQTLVFALERAVRDAARSQQKLVRMVVEGADIELDKKVLEMLKDPLLHLVRNAVAHGLETTEERALIGKPEEGVVRLQLQQRGNEVHILVSDDGRGFNLSALRHAYARRMNGMVDENATDDEIMSWAFLPGVTTASEVTSISGRGVGLDVVRQSLADIQGRISLESAPSRGTTFHLVVPISLAMMRGLLVRVGQEVYVLPLLAVEKIIEPQSVFVVGGRQMIRVDDKPLPLLSLAQVLRRTIPAAVTEKTPLAIILSVANQRLALLVDDVLTEQELAVKSLGKPLQRVPNVIGAALLGSGQPIVILNPADLVKSASNVQPQLDTRLVRSKDKEQETKVHVLVVDDSITTRTLEKNILEAAGYEVTTATDGTEALKRLSEYDTIKIVVADVEMPLMNGIQLVEQLRASNRYSTMPIILVTSLESREDRERGMLAGADAYIVKRGFDQAELLATIQHLL